jgi:hypothetical protein
MVHSLLALRCALKRCIVAMCVLPNNLSTEESFMRRKRHELMARHLRNEIKRISDGQPHGKKQRRSRIYIRQPYFHSPYSSTWWRKYLDPNINDNPFHTQEGHQALQFRNRFRVPWAVFVWLLAKCRENGHFKETRDCTGLPSTPLEILLLGALAIIGDTISFIMLQETTNVSAQTFRNFIVHFASWGASILFPLKVQTPQTNDEIAECVRVYEALGFPGTIGSIDATHVELHNCPDNLKHVSTGKEGFPTRAFQIVVNFDRRIIHTTEGFFGSWNDKTISRYDQFVLDLQNNLIGSTFPWSTIDDSGQSVERTGSLHCICDGGYPPLSCLVSPLVPTSDDATVKWNARLVKIRKDVECCFGCLKKRFRILKKGLSFGTFDFMNNLWYTCCALHNLLLDFNEDINECDEGFEVRDTTIDQEELAAIPPTLHTLGRRRTALINHYDYKSERKEVPWIQRRERVKFSFDDRE